MSKKGLTLIEVIISIAIISVLALSFFSMFLNGFKGVVRSGNRSNAGMKVQGRIEQAISLAPAKSPSNDTLNINFSNGTSIAVKGKYETQTENINGSQVTYSVFNPVD